MTEALIVAPQVEVARAAVEPVVTAADTMLVVSNVEQHTAALALLVDVMAAETRVKRMFEPSIEAAKEAKRRADVARAEIVALRDSVLADVTAARETISAKCAAFERAEREAAQVIQRQLAAEAAAKKAAEDEFDAAMAETPEDVKAAEIEALRPPVVPVVKPEVAKVAGVVTRETWSAEVYDRLAFYRWCVETNDMFSAGDPNMTALNMRARTEKGAMSIPGVRAVSSLSHARR